MPAMAESYVFDFIRRDAVASAVRASRLKLRAGVPPAHRVATDNSTPTRRRRRRSQDRQSGSIRKMKLVVAARGAPPRNNHSQAALEQNNSSSYHVGLVMNTTEAPVKLTHNEVIKEAIPTLAGTISRFLPAG